MRRIVFTMMLALATMASWAQRWTAPSDNSNPDETNIYVSLTLNGQQVTENGPAVELAAFVGDEVRAVETSVYVDQSGTTTKPPSYRLRVRGNKDTDTGKTITLKAYVDGVVYKLNKTFSWNGETVEPVPTEVSFTTITGIQNTAPQVVEVSLPGTKDMSTYVSLLYNGSTTIEGASIDTDETEVFYKWDAANSASYFTIDDKGVLTAVSETQDYPAWLGMDVMINDKGLDPNGNPIGEQRFTKADPQSFSIQITKPTVLPTSIAYNGDVPVTIWKGENLYNQIANNVVVLPADATDATWRIVDSELITQNTAAKGGEGTVTLQTNSGDGITTTIDVIVKVHPELVDITNQLVEVEVGESAVDAIKAVVSLSAPDEDPAYVDQEYTITPDDATLYNNSTGIATKVGQTAVTIAATNGPATHAVTGTLTLVVKKSVKSIELESGDITVYVGENVKDVIANRVTIVPADATNADFDIVEEAETLLIDAASGRATMAGVTTVRVASSENPEIISTGSVTVNILEHPYAIEGPKYLSVYIGENVWQKILDSLTFYPDHQNVDKSINIEADNYLWDGEYIATTEGTATATVTAVGGLVPTDNSQPTATIVINVIKPTVYPTSITLESKRDTVYVEDGTNLNELLADRVTVLPADASNTDWWIEPVNENDYAYISDGIFTRPGEYELRVAIGGSDNQIFNSDNTTTVVVMARPTGVTAENVTVKVGDNVLEAIEAALTFTSAWDEDEVASQYVDRTFTIGTSSPYYESDYVAATPTGSNGIAVQVNTNGMNADGAPVTATVNLIIVQPVTSITAETTTITASVNDDVISQIRELVTVLPENASNKNLVFTVDKDGLNADSGMAEQAGTYVVTVASEDNPEATLTFTVTVYEELQLTVPEVTELSVGETVTLTIVKNDDSAPIDGSKIRIEIDGTELYGPAATATVATTDGLTWNITGLVPGGYGFHVYYGEEGEELAYGNLYISQAVNLTSGWDWITINTTNTIPLYTNGAWIAELQKDATNKIIEVRSQKDLLYNDPTIGAFGDITELKAGDGMYKVKTDGSVKFDLGVDVPEISSEDLPQITTGYTWVGYPHQIDQPLSLLADALAEGAEEGDMILGKDNFATFSNGEWVAQSGFTFYAGKGYMYYTAGNGGRNINWGWPQYVPGYVVNDGDIPALTDEDWNGGNKVGAKAENASRIWNYDASLYPDNMAIIAQLDGIADPENYSVGAFVGDECRGKGEVAGGRYMFINVAGKSGDQVTFKLYDKRTGIYRDLQETVAYGGKAGSIQNPLTIGAELTGIRTISAGETAEGAVAVQGNNVVVNGITGGVVTIVNAAGKVVRTSTEQVVSLNGLPGGVYIVTVSAGAQRISKKIVK